MTNIPRLTHFFFSYKFMDQHSLNRCILPLIRVKQIQNLFQHKVSDRRRTFLEMKKYRFQNRLYKYTLRDESPSRASSKPRIRSDIRRFDPWWKMCCRMSDTLRPAWNKPHRSQMMHEKRKGHRPWDIFNQIPEHLVNFDPFLIALWK